MLTVKDLMSSELHVLRPNDNIFQARTMMLEKRVRHIPVLTEGGEFVGLITKRDVLDVSVSVLADIDTKEREEIDSCIPVKEVMIRNVIIATEETSLLEAARYMLEQKHGCLPVFEDDKLVGIITEADFVDLAIHLMERIELNEKKQNVTQ